MLKGEDPVYYTESLVCRRRQQKMDGRGGEGRGGEGGTQGETEQCEENGC